MVSWSLTGDIFFTIIGQTVYYISRMAQKPNFVAVLVIAPFPVCTCYYVEENLGHVALLLKLENTRNL